MAGGAAAGEAVLGAFRGDFEGALDAAAGLRREEVRAAVERALEAWLFGPAGRPQHRTCPSCGEGRPGLGFGRHGPFVGRARHGADGDGGERDHVRAGARAARPPAQGGDASGTGKTTLAGIGRYGQWLEHGAAYVPLPEDEDVLTVGLSRAVALVDTG